METNKLFGSTLIIIGTMIGAGMLALPMISAGVGFFVAVGLLVLIWMLMTLTGLYTLEVNLAFEPYVNSFSTMSAATLGRIGKAISWVCTLCLLYALTAAYISGNANLLDHLIELNFQVKTPPVVNALLFVVVMGGMVYWNTQVVDYCNRFLLSFKGLFLATTLILLMPQINFVNLIRDNPEISKYIWSIIPIFLCSFGFHPTVPSLTNYLGRKPRELKFAIICGSLTTLVIYLLWLLVVIGTVPWGGDLGFAKLLGAEGSMKENLGHFIQVIYTLADNKWVTVSVNSFSNIAMTTSFLGVALGLFDFLADGFKRTNTRLGRLQTALLCFIPPFIFALFYPNGFILALKYAAIFATLLVVIFPPLMAFRLRKNASLLSSYRVFGGNFLIIVTIAIGAILMVVQILNHLGWL